MTGKPLTDAERLEVLVELTGNAWENGHYILDWTDEAIANDLRECSDDVSGWTDEELRRAIIQLRALENTT